jgi:hypothetical protein
MKTILRVATALLIATSMGACSRAEPTPTAPARTDPPKTIGQATMQADGTIVMDLRMEDRASGAVGDGRFTIKPGDANYASTIEHLGGLKPGETKPVKNDWH